MPVEVVSLQSLCVKGYPARGKTPSEQATDGIPILKVRNVTGNGISMETDFAPDTDAVREECAKGMVRTGDVLITSTGEGTIGRVDPYLFQENAICDTHVTICRLKDGINRAYVEEFLKSEYGQIQMLRHVLGSTGQTELLTHDIAALLIPLPDSDIQRMIVEEMQQARTRSKELVDGARYLRDRSAIILASARTRMISRLSGQSGGGTDDLASNVFSDVPAGAGSDDLTAKFRAYVEVWRRETRHLSSLTRIVAHPAYRAIVDMGKSVLPLLLGELRDRPDHWLVALNKISGEDPAKPGSNFTEAIEAWLEWGRKRGYLK